MNFSINDEVLSYAIPTDDKLEISSFPKNYHVIWDSGPPCEKINASLDCNSNNLLLIDEKVFQLYGNQIQHPQTKIFLVPATETFKQLEGVNKVYDFLYRNNFSKSETLVVVGGGITQEIGAFVSATYKRGIPWIFFPTTLLAMADSCIGGKASINYQGAKNQLGLFSTPNTVIINPSFINTLDIKDIFSGLGEILKMAIIGGAAFLQSYKQYILNSDYKNLILSALVVKKAVIEKDEFEQNIRKVLNYGHTIGHAIESMSNYQIPHGTAVVVGIMLANEIAVGRGLLERQVCDELHKLCLQLIDDSIFYILKNMDLNNLEFYLKQDKKIWDDQVVFVLLNHPGKMSFEIGKNLHEIKECFYKFFM